MGLIIFIAIITAIIISVMKKRRIKEIEEKAAKAKIQQIKYDQIKEEREKAEQQIKLREEARHKREIEELNHRIEEAPKSNINLQPTQAVENSFESSETLFSPLEFSDGRILKYYYPDVQIELLSDQSLPSYCSINTPLEAKLSPTNNNKKNISLFTLEGDLIGNMFENRLSKMVYDYLKKDDMISIHIASNKPENNTLLVSLAFYKTISSEDAEATFKITLSESKYDDWGYYEIGDELNISYDYDKDKYMIEDLVKFPDRYTDYIEDGNFIFILLKDEEVLDEDGIETGKHKIKIGIFKIKSIND